MLESYVDSHHKPSGITFHLSFPALVMQLHREGGGRLLSSRRLEIRIAALGCVRSHSVLAGTVARCWTLPKLSFCASERPTRAGPRTR